MNFHFIYKVNIFDLFTAWFSFLFENIFHAFNSNPIYDKQNEHQQDMQEAVSFLFSAIFFLFISIRNDWLYG